MFSLPLSILGAQTQPKLSLWRLRLNLFLVAFRIGKSESLRAELDSNSMTLTLQSR
jgi:hypothetical protein